MDALGTFIVPSGGQASITFASIPQTYTHLHIRGIQKATNSYNQGMSLYLNVGASNTIDSGNNYENHQTAGNGNGSGVGSAGSTGQSKIGAQSVAGDGNSSDNYMFGSSVIDILDYTNTNKYKVVRIFAGVDMNTTGGGVCLASGLWLSTSAINTIQFTTEGNFQQYSSFSIYGVK